MDSIVQPCPDSVLALLQALEPAALSGNAADNRAYADMLAAQARYTAHIVPKADDTVAIDKAVERFDGTPLEARALVFSGTTRESLGDTLAAMGLYKRAEMAAREGRDTFYSAYAQMRMAWLYQCDFAFDRAIEKYRQGAEGFEAAGDSVRLLMCISKRGQMLFSKLSDDALPVMERSIELARALGQAEVWKEDMANLAEYRFYHLDYEGAYRIVNELLGRDDLNPGQRHKVLHIAVKAYAHLGKLDSAAMFLHQIPVYDDPASRMMMVRCKAELAYGRGDMRAYGMLSDSANTMSAAMLLDSRKSRLEEAEHGQERRVLADRLTRRRLDIAGLAVLLLSLSGVLFWLIRRFRRNRDELSTERSLRRQEQLNSRQLDRKLRRELDLLSSQRMDNEQIDERTFMTLVGSLNRLKLLDKSGDRHVARRQIAALLNQDMLNLVEDFVLQRFPDLPKKARELLPSERDVEMVYLSLCGFSNFSIACFLNYRTEHSVSTQKRILSRRAGEDSFEGLLGRLTGVPIELFDEETYAP